MGKRRLDTEYTTRVKNIPIGALCYYPNVKGNFLAWQPHKAFDKPIPDGEDYVGHPVACKPAEKVWILVLGFELVHKKRASCVPCLIGNASKIAWVPSDTFIVTWAQ